MKVIDKLHTPKDYSCRNCKNFKESVKYSPECNLKHMIKIKFLKDRRLRLQRYDTEHFILCFEYELK